MAFSRLRPPTRRFWRPQDEREFDTLREAADLTGGSSTCRASSPTATPRRSSRTCSTTTAAVTCCVTCRRASSARGGMTSTSPSRPIRRTKSTRAVATTSRPRPRPEAAPSRQRRPRDPPRAGRTTIGDLAQAYGQGDFLAFAGWLRQAQNLSDLISAFRAGGNPWPGQPRREAAFVLELADFGLQSRNAADREAARRLLLAHRALVRPPLELGPDPFERYWFWAARHDARRRQRLRDRADVRRRRPAPLSERAALRSRPRVHRRSAPPVRSLVGRAGQAQAGVLAAHVNEVTTLYDAAMAFDETAAEARVRKGWLLHRAGRHEEPSRSSTPRAIAARRHARPPPPAPPRPRAGRHRAPDAAVEAYRAAHALAPNAQSPKVALMTALQRQGDQRARWPWPRRFRAGRRTRSTRGGGTGGAITVCT